jgi:hypothetical protein
VNVPSVQRGRATPVQIQATAKANGKVSSVYLLIRATENAQFKADNGDKVSSSKVSYETRITVTNACEIKEGETYDWEGVVELPTNTNPTLRGSIIDHTWEIQAGLDMPGNDPDSGWTSFEVT